MCAIFKAWSKCVCKSLDVNYESDHCSLYINGKERFISIISLHILLTHFDITYYIANTMTEKGQNKNTNSKTKTKVKNTKTKVESKNKSRKQKQKEKAKTKV